MLPHIIIHFIDSKLKLLFPKLDEENTQEQETDFPTHTWKVRTRPADRATARVRPVLQSRARAPCMGTGTQPRRKVCVILSKSPGLLKHSLAVKIWIMRPTPEHSSDFENAASRVPSTGYTQETGAAGISSHHHRACPGTQSSPTEQKGSRGTRKSSSGRRPRPPLPGPTHLWSSTVVTITRVHTCAYTQTPVLGTFGRSTGLGLGSFLGGLLCPVPDAHLTSTVFSLHRTPAGGSCPPR